MIDECETLLKEMESEAESDRQERIYERFNEQFQEHYEIFKSLKPSIDRILGDKKLMRILE